MINRAAFESLVMHLKTLGPFLFRPNSGNGGDAIIALACMEMFDEIGLDWEAKLGLEEMCGDSFNLGLSKKG